MTKVTSVRLQIHKVHEIGKFVNPVCREALLALRKKNPAFKDFMNLKTGGHDYYSGLGSADLWQFANDNGVDVVTIASLPDEKSQLSALRWVMRGLSETEAVHKVKVDTEVKKNR